MLFNSYVFLFAFLPVVLAVFFALGHAGRRRAATVWLVLASLYFYAYWNLAYVPLLLGSLALNYGVGLGLSRLPDARRRTRRLLLAGGIAANLGLLGAFKYTDLALSTANALSGSAFELRHIVLPLAISFFTFNQIAYLVDVHRRLAREYDAINYAFFVTFFPHLIAGPIVHHRDVIPQLDTIPYRFRSADVSLGLTLFALGLFEKVALADPLAPVANAVFGAAPHAAVGAAWAWTGTTAYALQLYFDFAGYSTMAIGLARTVGIAFPANFNSPYRAASIVDFWRRWHMTLSRFLREYLYVPLGGNRHGPARRYAALFATMLLGGLWHGAAWTFVVWGGLHGLYLALNHAWEARGKHGPLARVQAHRLTRWAGYALTMLAVLVGWVFFRAADLPTALGLCAQLAGAAGAAPPDPGAVPVLLQSAPGAALLLRLSLGIALATLFPNALELVRAAAATDRPPLPLRWAPNQRWAIGIGALAAAAIALCANSSSFLYYQF
ncbi:MAG: alginate O-acetyltransferase complex protein AlgI [Candidatus Eremiobacteraeota bacterium]|jgi:D-alanyl-lipoteichoic acid acyltransferase DltB (MBOAT superfamily)|nr:alginate O-acetyltransferase complex protein AlgI [Candidatus Eremiobacteraeota bacterium]